MLVDINIEVNTIMEIGEHCCFHSCGQLGKSIFIMWYNAICVYHLVVQIPTVFGVL